MELVGDPNCSKELCCLPELDVNLWTINIIFFMGNVDNYDHLLDYMVLYQIHVNTHKWYFVKTQTLVNLFHFLAFLCNNELYKTITSN